MTHANGGQGGGDNQGGRKNYHQSVTIKQRLPTNKLKNGENGKF
jgi:hypothetical protein